VTPVARVRQARKCHAHRKNGEPCKAYAIIGGRVCRAHGGAAPQVRAAARERLLMARAYRALVILSRGPHEREHRAMRELAFPRGGDDHPVLDFAAAFAAGLDPPGPRVA
jgi:hypothetical protein